MGAVLTLCLSTLASLAHAQTDPRPNIVILLADDLGIGDLGCYGQTRIQTPRIDALAAESMLARHAYASAPVCAPSRCSLLTGLHSGHCSVDHNEEPNVPLGLSDPTLAEVLSREGYRTAIVGKWGLGGETDHGEDFARASLPTAFGFDHVYAVLDQELAQDHYPERVFVDGAWAAIPENAAGARARWDDDLFVDDALAFVDRARTDDRPLFLYFASTLPHRSLDPPTLAHGDAGWPEVERAYATMVERFDADVGRIVDRLDALDGERSTIVIVASDNGPVTVDAHDAAFFDSAAGRRGQKRDLYEGGLAVPLIVRWRGRIAPGTLDAPVVLYDLFPTLTDVIQAPAPRPMDGVSIAPWLTGARSDAVHERLFFSVSQPHGGSEGLTRFALREGPLVLIERDESVLELYDLVADPAQAHDLAADRQTDVARLHALREAESTGYVRRAFPILAVEGDARSDVPAPRSFVVIDQRGFDAEAPVPLPRGTCLPSEAEWETSIGDASFTLEARFSLDHVSAAPATSRTDRRYLASWKPARSHDELLDFGVLVQAGDLALPGDPDATGHELAFVFADPAIGGHGTWTIVARELTITDEQMHFVVFTFDAEHRRATVRLDDRSQTIAFEDLGHVRSDGLYVVGGHQDALGNYDGFLDGSLRRYRLSRGIVPDEAIDRVVPEPERTLTMDLGRLALGGTDVTRSLSIVDAAAAPSLAMQVDVRDVDLDARASLSVVPTRTVTEGVRVPLTFRFRPDAIGPIDERFTIVGFVSHYGMSTPGGLVHVVVTGEVVAPLSSWPRIPEWLLWVSAALTAAAIRLLFRARSGSRRA